MRKKNAFTLVELIVSISLVLLLFTLVVPGVARLINQSKIKQCEQIKENILTAVDLYVTENRISAGTIKLNDLYLGNYIDEKYEIDYNNSTIEQGIWKKGGNTENILINITKNSLNSSTYGYYTYNITTDFCN